MKRSFMDNINTGDARSQGTATDLFFARRLKDSEAVWLACRDRFLETFKTEFSDVEREDLGNECFCGFCRGYQRCRFVAPRNAIDVFRNIETTGLKAARLISKAGNAIGHRSDDVLISFGCGAGSCIAGLEFSRGSQFDQIFGVEIEPIAARFANATFPNLTIVDDAAKLEIPKHGRLIVLTSLVGNVIDWQTVQAWAQFIAGQRNEFLWINVGRDRDRNAIPSGEILLESLGWTRETLAPELSLPKWGDCHDPLNNGYTLEIGHWRV